jgi:hypothetical protein
MGRAAPVPYDRGVRTLAIVVCASVAGCGVTDFDIDQPVMEQRIPGSPLPGPLALLFPIPLDVNISAKIKEMETGPIDSVTLKSLTLSITATGVASGDTDDWSFVDEIHVFVKSNKSGTTLPRIEIANVRNPGALQTLTFTVDSDVDINPYVNEGSTVEGESSGTAPADEVTYDGKAVFTVHPL